MTTDDLTERLETLDATFGGPLDESDLPDGYTDPVAYLTDEEGTWDHLRHAQVLLEARGPSGPAWVALRELDELERTIDTLESRYLELRELARNVRIEREDREGDGVGYGELERVTRELEAGWVPDRRIFDSIRAQLVTLGDSDECISEPVL